MSCANSLRMVREAPVPAAAAQAMCSAGYAVRAPREALPGRLLPPHPSAAMHHWGKHLMAFGRQRADAHIRTVLEGLTPAYTVNATHRLCASGGAMTACSNTWRSPINTTWSTPRVRAV